MITTVKGRLKKGITWKEIFKNIFPGGSITGAPKIRAMQIIGELEKEDRKVYCGALGFITPENEAVFSIPIRTVLLTGKNGEMGIGSGIVYDSSVTEEYDEVLLKAKFLTEKIPDFKIFETMLWDKKYILLAGHLGRLRQSAEYFNFPLDIISIRRKLKKEEILLKSRNKYIIRLFLSKKGSVEIVKSEFDPWKKKKGYAVISHKRVDSSNKYLYHKTTMRELYERERKKIEGRNIFDVIFLNEKQEVTEGAITNIFIKKNGTFYTSPVSSGLLPGVYRDYLIKEKKAIIRVLKVKDLKKADKIYLVNSVRGMVEIKLRI
jgi:para-aminobenzoate synthetase/4-amino-4-deoxychorismate lyase